MKRPIGVTILAILAIVGAVLGILGALAVLGVSGFGFLGAASGSAVGIGLTLGITTMLLALVQLAFGVGALQLRSWAWTLGVVLYVLSMLNYLVAAFTIGLTTSVVIGIVVVGAILGYLFSHDVREAFGHLPNSTHGTPMVTH